MGLTQTLCHSFAVFLRARSSAHSLSSCMSNLCVTFFVNIMLTIICMPTTYRLWTIPKTVEISLVQLIVLFYACSLGCSLFLVFICSFCLRLCIPGKRRFTKACLLLLYFIMESSLFFSTSQLPSTPLTMASFLLVLSKLVSKILLRVG